MKSVAFHFSPKIQLAFGLGVIETMSPRTTFENRPIWSHWTRMKIEIFDLQRERESHHFQFSNDGCFSRIRVTRCWNKKKPKMFPELPKI